MEELFRFGQCYNFFRILKTVYPEAEPWYDQIEGHVYTKIGKFWYDVRGKHLRVAPSCTVLEHKRGHKPHRWGLSDFRRLQPVGVTQLKADMSQAEKVQVMLEQGVPQLNDFHGTLLQLQEIVAELIKRHGGEALIATDAGHNNVEFNVFHEVSRTEMLDAVAKRHQTP